MCPPSNKATRPADNGFDKQTLQDGSFPPTVTWNTSIKLVCPDQLWTVSGATKVAGFDFPTTMTVLRDPSSGDLCVVNALRFPDGLCDRIVALAGSPAARIHVVRLGAYHGAHDSFWVARYASRATLWALPEHKLQDGVVVQEVLSPVNVPVPGAELFVFDLPRPEAALVLPALRAVVFCDAVLNIDSYEFCRWYFRPVFLAMGFRGSTHRPDPLWSKWMVEMSSREALLGEYERLLGKYEFEVYTSGHGRACLEGGNRKIGDAVRTMFG
jgi:hypothetical protein